MQEGSMSTEGFFKTGVDIEEGDKGNMDLIRIGHNIQSPNSGKTFGIG